MDRFWSVAVNIDRICSVDVDRLLATIIVVVLHLDLHSVREGPFAFESEAVIICSLRDLGRKLCQSVENGSSENASAFAFLGVEQGGSVSDDEQSLQGGGCCRAAPIAAIIFGVGIPDETSDGDEPSVHASRYAMRLVIERKQLHVGHVHRPLVEEFGFFKLQFTKEGLGILLSNSAVVGVEFVVRALFIALVATVIFEGDALDDAFPIPNPGRDRAFCLRLCLRVTLSLLRFIRQFLLLREPFCDFPPLCKVDGVISELLKSPIIGEVKFDIRDGSPEVIEEHSIYLIAS